MMYKKNSLKNAASSILAILVILLTVSCAMVNHGSLKKGNVIESFNSGVYLSIKDGVSVGQELNVYEVIMNPKEPLTRPASKGIQTGKVKITEIFDNRIAKAAVISGKAEKGDIVELTGR